MGLLMSSIFSVITIVNLVFYVFVLFLFLASSRTAASAMITSPLSSLLLYIYIGDSLGVDATIIGNIIIVYFCSAKIIITVIWRGLGGLVYKFMNTLRRGGGGTYFITIDAMCIGFGGLRIYIWSFSFKGGGGRCIGWTDLISSGDRILETETASMMTAVDGRVGVGSCSVLQSGNAAR